MVKIVHGRERLMILLMSAGLVLLVMVLMMIQMLYRGLILRHTTNAYLLNSFQGTSIRLKKTYEIDVSKTSWFSSDLSTLKWFNDFNADFAIRLFSSRKIILNDFKMSKSLSRVLQ